MPFQNNPPPDPLIIPDGAGPGDPRIVIGTNLPPPLDTYIYNSGPFLVNFAAAILFYQGTPSDDDYAFMAIPGVGSATLSVVTGAVINGVVVERNANVPAGLSMEWSRTMALEDYFFGNFNIAPGFGGLRIGAETTDDSYVAPTNSAGVYAFVNRPFRNQAGPNPAQNYGGATFDPIPTMPNVGILKQYNGNITDIEATLSGFIQCSAVPLVAEIGMRFTGTNTDYPMGRIGFNQLGHAPFSLTQRIQGFGAGQYIGNFQSFQPVWRKISGPVGSVMVINQDDTYCYGIEEKGTIL